MRKFEYVVTATHADEPFAVSSYSLQGQGGVLPEHCPPIQMSITNCVSASSSWSIAHVLKLDTVVDQDFAGRYVDIALGIITDWKLVQFQVTADCLRLEFYHTSSGRFEYLTLDLRDSRITNLGLNFTVPHLSEHPATEYAVSMDYNSSNRDSPKHSLIIVEERLPSGDHNLFTFNSDHPDEITVTTYTDL